MVCKNKGKGIELDLKKKGCAKMDDIEQCPVCGKKGVVKQISYDPCAVFYKCSVCGKYEYSMENSTYDELDRNKLAPFLFYEGFKDKKGVVEHRYYSTKSGEICDTYIQEFKNGNNIAGLPVHMDQDIISLWFPTSFSLKVDMILLKLNNLAEFVGQTLKIDVPSLLSCMFVKRYNQNSQEQLDDKELVKQALYMTSYLFEVGYIDGSNSISGEISRDESYFGPISITPKGYDRIDQLQKETNGGKDALVAMRFGNETIKLREAIRQGVFDAGYNAVFIDEVEHNGFITPELLDRIKQSKFVVVDLTHKNNGAYFEEGYAMGLGKTVIQLCKKGVELHFDIAQINTIMWETEDDIPLRLRNRIKATIN